MLNTKPPLTFSLEMFITSREQVETSQEVRLSVHLSSPPFLPLNTHNTASPPRPECTHTRVMDGQSFQFPPISTESETQVGGLLTNLSAHINSVSFLPCP